MFLFLIFFLYCTACRIFIINKYLINHNSYSAQHVYKILSAFNKQTAPLAMTLS